MRDARMVRAVEREARVVLHESAHVNGRGDFSHVSQWQAERSRKIVDARFAEIQSTGLFTNVDALRIARGGLPTQDLRAARRTLRDKLAARYPDALRPDAYADAPNRPGILDRPEPRAYDHANHEASVREILARASNPATGWLDKE